MFRQLKAAFIHWWRQLKAVEMFEPKMFLWLVWISLEWTTYLVNQAFSRCLTMHCRLPHWAWCHQIMYGSHTDGILNHFGSRAKTMVLPTRPLISAAENRFWALLIKWFSSTTFLVTMNETEAIQLLETWWEARYCNAKESLLQSALVLIRNLFERIWQCTKEHYDSLSWYLHVKCVDII